MGRVACEHEKVVAKSGNDTGALEKLEANTGKVAPELEKVAAKLGKVNGVSRKLAANAIKNRW